jgi:RNA polymerase sigma-70 factor (family 1)
MNFQESTGKFYVEKLNNSPSLKACGVERNRSEVTFSGKGIFSFQYEKIPSTFEKDLLAMDYLLQKDEALLELLCQSDTKAFNEIYRRYWQVVFRYAISKVPAQEIAEDICQDIFVSLWQRRAVLSIQNLEAYLVQATKYGVLSYIRLQVQDRKHMALAKSYKVADNETENSTALHILMEAWEKAISGLPPKTQHIFRLSNIEDYSNKEIASMLDLTEKAVEYHITKSYKSIRLQLQDYAVLLMIIFLLK